MKMRLLNHGTTNLKTSISAALLTLMLALPGIGQNAPRLPMPSQNAPRLPMPGQTAPRVPGSIPGPLQINPTTGLPVSVPAWKDDNWPDPDKKISVGFDGVPISDVAQKLREEFGEAFDIVMPNNFLPAGGSRPVWVSTATMKIQLKNVTASEAFNAMNMLFESENTALQWQLRMNGQRPMAVLKVTMPIPPVDNTQRQVFFVGEMIDDRPGGMSMKQLVQTVSEIHDMSFAGGRMSDHLQFHEGAQLLVVTGSQDEINFVSETLNALRGRANLARQREREKELQKAKKYPKANEKTETDAPAEKEAR